jgi:Lar family restriction alleviation protein
MDRAIREMQALADYDRLRAIIERAAPCPFCGSQQLEVPMTGRYSTLYQVVCEICYAKGPYGDHEAKAVERWSIRPTSQVNKEEPS